MVRYILAWFPMLVIAVLNGAARDFFYKAKLGELRAHQVSTLTAMILFTVYVYLVDLLWPFLSGSQAIVVGIIWVLMTIVFEFGFGHYVAKHSWEKLLTDYNILKGRVWGLFLVYLLFLPLMVYSI